jgi:hypothetical protein
MEAILKKLRERYDVIILDLPPIIGLADGRFLAALADTTAVVVHWDKTPTHAVSSALGRLRSDGANLSGVILNMVDSRRNRSAASIIRKSMPDTTTRPDGFRSPGKRSGAGVDVSHPESKRPIGAVTIVVIGACVTAITASAWCCCAMRRPATPKPRSPNRTGH